MPHYNIREAGITAQLQRKPVLQCNYKGSCWDSTRRLLPQHAPHSHTHSYTQSHTHTQRFWNRLSRSTMPRAGTVCLVWHVTSALWAVFHVGWKYRLVGSGLLMMPHLTCLLLPSATVQHGSKRLTGPAEIGQVLPHLNCYPLCHAGLLLHC